MIWMLITRKEIVRIESKFICVIDFIFDMPLFCMSYIKRLALSHVCYICLHALLCVYSFYIDSCICLYTIQPLVVWHV